MLQIKFYLNTQEIVREQAAAVKGVYYQSIDPTSEPLPGSKGEMLLLKVRLLALEAENAQKTASVRSSTEYYQAKQETIRLNKLKYDGFIICEYCKSICTAETGSVLRHTVDHVIPLSEGGDPLDQANLKIACRFCNRLKGSLSEEVFLRMVKNGKRDLALTRFESYLAQNNLEATNDALASFVNKHRKTL